MESIHVKKGVILQKEGDYSTVVYKVISGLLRSYSIDANGKEHVFMFAPENWIIGDVTSLGNTNKLYIETLEDSEIIVIPKDSIHLTDSKKLLRRIEVLQNRIIRLMSDSATERYLHFLKTYPDITQRVPQKMIASYIGITPEALSTVKKKHLGN